jgi:hypothetical protein
MRVAYIHPAAKSVELGNAGTAEGPVIEVLSLINGGAYEAFS